MLNNIILGPPTFIKGNAVRSTDEINVHYTNVGKKLQQQKNK